MARKEIIKGTKEGENVTKIKSRVRRKGGLVEGTRPEHFIIYKEGCGDFTLSGAANTARSIAQYYPPP